jgi:hypothetical protein
MNRMLLFLMGLGVLTVPGCDFAMTHGPMLRNESNQPVWISVHHRNGVTFPRNSPVAGNAAIPLGIHEGSVRKVVIRTGEDRSEKVEVDLEERGSVQYSSNPATIVVTRQREVVLRPRS